MDIEILNKFYLIEICLTCATKSIRLVTVFLSGANLTEYAFTLNMELGVLIREGNLPSDVISHFDELI